MNMTYGLSKMTGNLPHSVHPVSDGRSGWTAWKLRNLPIFSCAGSIELFPISVELTYGLERIAMYLQGVDNVYDLKWNDDVTYGDVHHQQEVEQSTYNFEKADVVCCSIFLINMKLNPDELIEETLILPAYEYCLKCSHTFNLLDARGAISVTERTGYIGRIRNLARACAEEYLKQREAMGYPLLKKDK